MFSLFVYDLINSFGKSLTYVLAELYVCFIKEEINLFLVAVGCVLSNVLFV